MSRHDHREADRHPSTTYAQTQPAPGDGLLSLSYFDRLALAKSECAMVFELRSGEITERHVFDVVEHWTVAPRGAGSRADHDLLAGHLLAWID